jgi:hypothetical protein
LVRLQREQQHWGDQYLTGSGAAVLPRHLPVVGHSVDEITCTTCGDR